MGDPLPFINLLLVIFLVFLNGFFVASEFAIVKVRSTRIAQLIDEGHKRAKIAEKVISNLDGYLSATQLGITLASLGLGWIGEPAIARLIAPVLTPYLSESAVSFISFVLAFAIISFLHIVLGELAPKSLAIQKAESTTLWVSLPLRFFHIVFYPAIFVLNGTANWLLKLIGIEPSEEELTHSDEEIRMIMVQSHQSGKIDHTEMQLLDNVFDFSDRLAREIMVPRVDMVCLYLEESITENYNIIKKHKHTRYPLCNKDKDDIIGMVHIHDIYELLINGKPLDLSKIVRPLISIPETIEVKDALQILQKNRTEMAVVLDEYGGTAGLITVEDIVEELVGEIQGEFDNESPFFIEKGDSTSIDARLLIEDVNNYFGININDPDNDTIGGWLFLQLKSIPKIGQKVIWESYEFIVEQIDNKGISRITVKKFEEEKQSEVG